MKTLLRLALIIAVLSTAFCAFAADVPYLTGRVTDNAQILSDETRKSITERLKAYEDKTTNQIAVLTVPTLGGLGIEEYAVAVFKEWKLGQKGRDNGILVVVSPGERRMRIEVGYGLEGAMPDAAAGDIIRNVMTPHFKSGDYNGGIDSGVQAIITVLEGGKVPAGKNIEGFSEKSSGLKLQAPDMSIAERILIGAFIFGIIGLFTFMGIVTPGGGGWFLYFFLIPFWAMFPVVVLGSTGAFYLLMTYLISFPVAKVMLRNSDWYIKAAQDLKTKGHANIGGFMVTSGGSGSSWSSGSSSGGFSGGGGSSGGGGASGSW